MRATLLRWLGPAALALAMLLLYRVVVSDWLDDWAFLHDARMRVIQQQFQQQHQQAPPGK
jgi:hypothetical protein